MCRLAVAPRPLFAVAQFLNTELRIVIPLPARICRHSVCWPAEAACQSWKDTPSKRMFRGGRKSGGPPSSRCEWKGQTPQETSPPKNAMLDGPCHPDSVVPDVAEDDVAGLSRKLEIVERHPLQFEVGGSDPQFAVHRHVRPSCRLEDHARPCEAWPGLDRLRSVPPSADAHGRPRTRKRVGARQVGRAQPGYSVPRPSQRRARRARTGRRPPGCGTRRFRSGQVQGPRGRIVQKVSVRGVRDSVWMRQ